MAAKKAVVSWYGHDHADAYLLTAAHHLARGASNPTTLPLTPPSVSATLYCAFAAEAYVNVALIRMLGEDEYAHVSKMRVRTKYFLSTRLATREDWFSSGERVLESISELFTERNRLVHAQPERTILHPFSDPDDPAMHADLRNVARWIDATADAVCRLARSHAELHELDRVAGRLADLHLARFDPLRDGERLERDVIDVAVALLHEDDRHDLAEELDPEWDLRGLRSDE